MNADDLATLNIMCDPLLTLKHGYQDDIQTTVSYGHNEFWSSDNLYHHINSLENLVSTTVRH